MMALPDKVIAVARRALRTRAERLLRLLDLGTPSVILANQGRLVYDAACMLDPDTIADGIREELARGARRYAQVCVWDGVCEADATTDDGLCAAHAAEQVREDVEARALLERVEFDAEDAS